MLKINQALLDFLILSFSRLLFAVVILLPGLLIAYLHEFQDTSLTYMSHGFHVVAISIAILVGAFVSYVTWLCYRDSGEVLLRWLVLGMLGYTLVYAPHGIFTPLAQSHPALFLFYGPAARLVMATCFLVAMLCFLKRADDVERRQHNKPWLYAMVFFILIDLLVAGLAVSPWQASPVVRPGMDYAAMLVFLLTIVIMLVRKIRNPLMLLYMLALCWFAQASLSFTLSQPWSHQWWLAHVVFAAAFLLLSFGVLQAYQSTRSFTKVYSQAELLQQILTEKRRAEQALIELQSANSELERLAATDPLTGAANRRELMQRIGQEVSRASRNHQPLALLMADLDHFKQINDVHTHQVGDDVLREFVRVTIDSLRPSDVLGRIGGEEFAVLLPDSELHKAIQVAERVRRAVEQNEIRINGTKIRITVSIGVAEYQFEQESIQDWFRRADEQLYVAKQAGRNRVAPMHEA